MRTEIRLILALVLLSHFAKGQGNVIPSADFPEDEKLNEVIETTADRLINSLQQVEEERQMKQLLTLSFLENDFPITCITDLERARLIDHIQHTGKLICWEELSVLGLSKSSINCLREYFLPDTSKEINLEDTRKTLKKSKVEITATIRNQLIEGYRYKVAETTPGDALNSALRIRGYNPVGIRFGVNMEKDPHESWWNNHGPDHFGYFMKLQPITKHWSLIAGDYDLQLGQGLIHGKGTFSSLGSEPLRIAKTGSGAFTHSSMVETGYSKGIAFTWFSKQWNFILAGSGKQQDGTLEYNPANGTTSFSEDQSGYHITTRQLSNRNRNTEKSVTGMIEWKHRALRIGLESEKIWSTHEQHPTTDPYQLFNRTGKNQESIGINYRWQYRNFYIFGELAKVLRTGAAFTSGILWNASSRITAAVSYRNYGKDFNPSYADALVEGSKTANESGLYSAITLKLSERMSVTGFTDTYRKPWIGYRVTSSQYGTSRGLRLTFTEGKNLDCYILMRNQSWLLDDPADKFIPSLTTQCATQLRCHCAIKPAFGWMLQSRIEFKTLERIPEKKRSGYLMYHEAAYSGKNGRWKLVGRITVFNTPDYSIVLYCRESDLRYTYEQSMNYGKGTSMYILTQFKITNAADAGLKLGKTTLSNRWLEDDYSGIQGKTKLNISLQVRFNFSE